MAILFKPLGHENTEHKLDIKVGNNPIPIVEGCKLLGIWLDSNLNWKMHYSQLLTKIKRNRSLLQISKKTLLSVTKRLMYFAHIYSHIQYGIVCWGNMLNQSQLNKLQKKQEKCVKLLNTNKTKKECYKEYSIMTIQEILLLVNCKLGYRLVNQNLPQRVHELMTQDASGQSLLRTHQYNTRKKNIPKTPKYRNKDYTNTFLVKAIQSYQSLSNEIRSQKTLKSFTHALKKTIIQ